MCGYDPFELYEQQLDLEYLAFEHGYDCYEDYYNSLQDDKTNNDYDSIADDMVEKGNKQ